MTRQTIKEAHLYEENDNYYLEVRYEIENNYDIREVHVPRIRVPFEFASLEHTTESIGNRQATTTELVLPYKGLICYPGTAYFVNNEDGKTHTHPGVAFATKIIKEKKTDMTIEEIEAKLGYKIRIVNKKEE